MKNAFKELNIDVDFTEEEVKEVFYNLMKKNYDQLNCDDKVASLAKKRIEKIEEAYEIISSIKDFDYLEDKYDVIYSLYEEYRNEKNYDKALMLADELIDFIPIFSDSYLLKADLLAEMNEHEEAIKYLKAQSQIEAKKYEDAIFTLTNITKLHGDNPFFFFDIACCYQGLGNEKMYKYYCEKRDEYWKNHKND